MRATRHPGSATRGLTWRTTVALVLTAVIPVLLVGGLAVSSLQRSLTERAATDLALLADAQAGRLELIGSAAATNARLIASRTQLRRDVAMLLAGEQERLARIDDILDDTVGATPQVLGVSLLDGDGVLLAGSRDLAAAAGPDIDQTTAELSDPDTVASVIVAGAAHDRWVVATPLILGTDLLGTALVELDLSSIFEVVASVDAGPAAARTCVFHARDDGSLTPLRSPAGTASDCATDQLPQAPEIATAPRGELASALITDLDRPLDGPDAAGERVLAAGREIAATGWLVVVSVPHDQLLAPVRPTTATLAAAALLSALLAGVAAVVLARRLTGPIGRLAGAVRDIGDGDLSARAPAEGPGELGELADGVNRMAAAIEQQARDSEQRYRDLEALTHAMAHDLKGPLTTVHGMLELVASERVTDPGQRVELLGRARRATVRMQHLIADLLTLVRAHGAQLQHHPVDLGQVVDAAIEDLGVADVVERQPLPSVPGDRILLEHVAQNLVSNAVAYHAPGVEPRVVISATCTDEAVELCIDDAGVGIPVAERAEVLELFSRGERTRATRGTGLGLPIAVRAVERHGGEVRIEDSPLGGTRMRVCLPTGGIDAARDGAARG